MRINKRGRVLLPVQAASISYLLHWHVDREVEQKLDIKVSDGPSDMYQGDASSFRHEATSEIIP